MFRVRWWLGTGIVACGCQRADGRLQPDSSAQDSQPIAASRPAPSASESAAPGTQASSSQQAAGAADGGSQWSGGTWISCYAGFRAESTPERDVIRLSLLCGPYHGLRAIGPPEMGTLAESAEPSRHSFTAKHGQCVRLFVAAEPGVQALRVALVGPEPQPIVKFEGAERWAAVSPTGAVCVETDGTYTVEISAAKGHGDYAVQTWLLP